MNMPYQQPMMNYTPNYGAYQYNPMASYQRYQQPEPTQGISGRVVQAVETINPNEVPMDGSVAFFPKQDLTEIYANSRNCTGWNPQQAKRADLLRLKCFYSSSKSSRKNTKPLRVPEPIATSSIPQSNSHSCRSCKSCILSKLSFVKAFSKLYITISSESHFFNSSINSLTFINYFIPP